MKSRRLMSEIPRDKPEILLVRMVVRVRVGHLPRSHDVQFEYRRAVFGYSIDREAPDRFRESPTRRLRVISEPRLRRDSRGRHGCVREELAARVRRF